MRGTGRFRTLAVGIAVVALVATGCEWSFQTLDGDGGGHGQTTNSVGFHSTAVVYNGRPHVFYYDGNAQELRHGYWNGVFWAFETLDGHKTGPHGEVNRDVGEYASAVVYNGRPHLFYRDEGAVELRHGYYNGQFWAFETLDGHTAGPNGQLVANTGEHLTAILYNGRPHLFYYDRTNEVLRHAWYNGVAWIFESLDGMGGGGGRTTNDVGWYTTAVIYNGRPQVFYYDTDGLDLRHGYYNGVAWGFETLDGHQNGPNGRKLGRAGVDNSAVIYNGRPHVFYADTTANADLRHAYFTGSGWGFETLDGHQNGPNGQVLGKVGTEGSAVVSTGRLRVLYWDENESDLRHGYYTGFAWGFETLDGHQNGPNGRMLGIAGRHVSTLADGSRTRVFYAGGVPTYNLRHAWFG